MAYKITWTQDGVLISILDHGTVAVHAEACHEVFVNPKIKHAKYIIFNTCDMNDFTATENDSIEIAGNDFFRASSAATQPLKVALVTNNKKLSRLMDVYMEESQDIGNHWTIKKFFSLNEAENWVNT